MNSKAPAYLYEKNNLIKLILFTAIFALLFINIFQPFGSRNWYPYISEFSYFFFSSLIILTGMLVVVVSRVIMYKYAKKHTITYWKYGIWILAEILAMTTFFTLFSKFIPESGKERDIVSIFEQSFMNTSTVLLLPYAILWLYFSWKDKKNQLEKISQEDTSALNNKKHLIPFTDEKGELRISIMLENLLYIDSADNYVTIHYINKSKLSGFLLRNSLKWVDEHLTAETPLVRCHRSFVVNLDKVKVLRKTKSGIFLELDAENTPDIPVTKTYYNKVMQKFSQYSV